MTQSLLNGRAHLTRRQIVLMGAVGTMTLMLGGCSPQAKPLG